MREMILVHTNDLRTPLSRGRMAKKESDDNGREPQGRVKKLDKDSLDDKLTEIGELAFCCYVGVCARLSYPRSWSNP